MTKLKICGVTQASAVPLLAQAGVDALGLNFWPHSKRFVEPIQVASWSISWPASLRRVGLFVNSTQEQINAVVELGFLDSLQLHGDESAEFLQSLAPLGLPVVKALSLPEGGGLPDWRSWQDAGAQGLLLDAHAPGLYGGTGKRIDWERAAEFVKVCPLPVWLAGGLKPENLAEAIAQVRPAWADLASGAEQSAGVQDERKIRQLGQIIQAQ